MIEQPLELSFTFSQDRLDDLTMDELAQLADAQMGENISIRELLDLMAHFVDNGTGQQMVYAEARRKLGGLKVRQQRTLAERWRAAWESFAVPPASGEQS